MQYRVIFFPGTGGDGFINLLEKAKNIVTADGEPKFMSDGSPLWREDEIVDGHLKFYGPKWTTSNLTPFRDYGVTNYEINPFYMDLLNNGKTTIVGSHYNYWHEIFNFKERELVEKNFVLIHLYSSDIDSTINKCIIKNKLTPDIVHENIDKWYRSIRVQLRSKNYQIHIDISKVYKDWNYLNECLNTIGIELDKKYYDEWLTVITI